MINNLLRTPNSWSFLVDSASYSLVAALLMLVVLARPVFRLQQARAKKTNAVDTDGSSRRSA